MTESALVTSLAQSLVDESPDALIGVSVKGDVLFWNRGARSLFGFSSEEARGRSIDELIVPVDDTGPKLTFALQAALREGEATFDASQKRRDGGHVDVEVTLKVVRDEKGRARFVTLHERDRGPSVPRESDGAIRIASRALHAQEARFRALIEKSKEAIALVSDEGLVFYLSPAGERLLGYKLGTTAGHRVMDTVHPDDRDRVLAMMNRVRSRPGHSVTYEARVVRHDGEVRWIETDATNMLEDPDIGGVVVNFRDVTERRLASQVLAESEARFRRMIETTRLGVWQVDARGVTTFANAPMAEMLGSTTAEIIGRPVLEFVDEGGREQILRSEIHTSRRPVHMELKLVRKDGTQVWTLLHATPFFGANGEFEGACAMVTDTTERRRSDEALRASEARFRSLWESRVLLISISDESGRILDMNDAGLTMLGYAREEIVEGGVSWTDLTPPEWRIAEAAVKEQLSARSVAVSWEKEIFRKDGSRIPVLTSAAQLDSETGLAVAVDLTHAKRTERDLVERMRIDALTAEVAMNLTRPGTQRQNLQACAEALARHLGADLVRIWTAGASKAVLELQASAGMSTKIDGASARVRVGEHEVGQVAAERRPRLVHRLLGGPLLFDLPATEPVAFAGHPLIVGGELFGVMGLFARTPRSELQLRAFGSAADAIAVALKAHAAEQARSELESQLRQSQKMDAIGRLAGGVAHDFNNVLSVILSYTDMVLSDLRPSDPLREDMDEIRKAGSRAADLTRQLLMFSRQQVLESKILDLNELLASMERMLGRMLGEDIDFSTKRTPGLWSILADPGSIEQVIMNLVVNARDAMPRGGMLTIETKNVTLDADYAEHHVGSKPGEHVMLAVSDNGLGMDRATQARIFEPFFTTKEQGKGTGLGLSTVFGIVHQSGGHVWVYSEPGRGTTMKVFLPRSAHDAPEVTRPPEPSTLRGTETVLLVEDEDQLRVVARGILQRNGYTVLEARNAGEALLLCERHPGTIDLLLTDVVMPGMGGAELAKRLTRDRPSLRVLCMSGYTDDSIVRHGVLAAEFAYLQKPITPTTLTRKVREVLDGAALSRRG